MPVKAAAEHPAPAVQTQPRLSWTFVVSLLTLVFCVVLQNQWNLGGKHSFVPTRPSIFQQLGRLAADVPGVSSWGACRFEQVRELAHG